jgi:hypothetical protein
MASRATAAGPLGVPVVASPARGARALVVGAADHLCRQIARHGLPTHSWPALSQGVPALALTADEAQRCWACSSVQSARAPASPKIAIMLTALSR